MTRCSEPGCNARCLSPHTRCSRHRPHPKRSRQGSRVSQRASHARERVRRALSGLAPGWVW